MENDPSLNTQETTVTASTTEEAQTLDPAPRLNKDHQEVETIGPGSTDIDAQSENPDETDYGKYLKDIEGENSQSFQGGEQGHQLPSESLSEDPVDPEPKCSPSDKVGKTDAHVVGSPAALPEHVSDGPGASQEPPVVDPQDAQSPGHSSAGPESQHTLRKRLLAPGEKSPEPVLLCTILSQHRWGPSFQRASLYFIGLRPLHLAQGHKEI